MRCLSPTSASTERSSTAIRTLAADFESMPAALQASLSATGLTVKHNDFLLKFSVPPYEMTVFGDGRAILKGSTDPAVARSLYARYIGA